MIANSGFDHGADFIGMARRLTLLACLTFVLAACGGGGSGEPAPTPPPSSGGPPTNPPSAEPSPSQRKAQNAKLSILQIGSQLTIRWLDTFDDELGYEIQRRVGDGNWQVEEALSSLDGGFAEWQRNVDTPARYRVVVRLAGESLPLHAAPDVTEIPIEPGTLLAIEFDRPEPVHNNVQVSMPSAAPAISATYLLDSAQVAVASNGTLTATLPQQHLVDGERWLVALVEKSVGLWVLSMRQFQVDNPAPAVLLRYQLPREAGEQFGLSARASSDAGITSVEFFVDGNSVHVANTTNSLGEYQYWSDPATLASGAHVVRAVATDSTTATASMQAELTLDQIPSLSVSGVFDGMIAGSGLSIQGSFGDDAPGATLTVSLGAERLLRTQTSPFTLSSALSALTPGEHSLAIRVADAAGKVNSRSFQIIVPSTNLQYELIANDVAELLAADQGAVLYQRRSGELALRNVAGVTTAGPSNAGIARFWLSNGRVLAQDLNRHVYAYDASMLRADLTPQLSQVPNIAPTLRNHWLTWTPASTPTRLFAYDVSHGQLSDVTFGGTAAALTPHDMITTPGNEQLVFQAVVNGVDGIYRHTLATSSTELVRAGSHTDVRTDGTRLAWRAGEHLVAAPLDNPTASTPITTSGLQYYLLDDGVFCWVDNTNRVNVSDGASATQLGALVSAHHHMLNDGHVIFATEGKTRTWNRTSGARVLVDAVVSKMIQSGGVAYFLTGTSGALYRVTLP